MFPKRGSYRQTPDTNSKPLALKLLIDENKVPLKICLSDCSIVKKINAVNHTFHTRGKSRHIALSRASWLRRLGSALPRPTPILPSKGPLLGRIEDAVRCIPYSEGSVVHRIGSRPSPGSRVRRPAHPRAQNEGTLQPSFGTKVLYWHAFSKNTRIIHP